MALSHSPRIITDGLVLCLDAGNYKSHLRYSSGWSGTYGSATNSFDGSTSTASGAVGGTFSATYTFPAPLITSSSTVRIFTDLGASSGQIGSTINIILINGVDITQKLKNAGAYAGSTQWIDITTEVGGVFKTIQLNGAGGVSNPGIYAVEVGGQVLVDSVTWTDLSGQGNNGTLNGAGYNSANGGSISFDGNDDRVEMTGKGLEFSNFSIEAIIKPSSNNGDYEAIISTTLGANNDYEYGLNWDLGPNATASFNVMNLEISRAYGGFVNRDVMTSSFPFNTWVHLFLTVSASSDFYKIYVNGVEDYSGTYLGTTTNFDRIVIGQRYYAGGYQGSSTFTGNIASVKIYNRVLTASEVSQNFNAMRGRYGI